MRNRNKNASSSYNDGGSGSDEESGPEPEAAEPQETINNMLLFASPSKLLELPDNIPGLGQFNTSFYNILDQLKQGKAWWVQCLTIYLAAALTYSYNNAGDNSTNVQIAIMTVIILVGATPFAASHLIPTAIGAFVGGHNIIGSTGLMDESAKDQEQHVDARNYLWLLLLSSVVGLIWSFVITNPNLKVLDGYAGRLGTTTFLGMNLTMLTIFGPAGVVDWNRYYYGFVHVIHFGEAEDSNTLSALMGNAWKWTEEAEVAIGYVLSVLWIGVVAGGTRILHNNYVQRCKDDEPSSSTATEDKKQQPPKPLNNVLVPCIYALLSMLIINATNYKHATGLFNGFAVGAYVAMASLQRIPSIAKFASVSLVASLWGLTLTPFFVGFAGKSGFTSMLGHVTHNVIESLFHKLQKMRNKRRRELQRQLEQLQLDMQEQQQQRDDIKLRQETQPASPYLQHHHKPKKETFYTKQQRRQQKRLKHLHSHDEQQLLQQEAGAQHDHHLHHRAWSALPMDGDDGVWQHSLEAQEHQELHGVV